MQPGHSLWVLSIMNENEVKISRCFYRRLKETHLEVRVRERMKHHRQIMSSGKSEFSIIITSFASQTSVECEEEILQHH